MKQYRNGPIFVDEIALKDIVCNFAAILSRGWFNMWTKSYSFLQYVECCRPWGSTAREKKNADFPQICHHSSTPPPMHLTKNTRGNVALFCEYQNQVYQPCVSFNSLGKTCCRHQMETFSVLLAVCVGNPLVITWYDCPSANERTLKNISKWII